VVITQQVINENMLDDKNHSINGDDCDSVTSKDKILYIYIYIYIYILFKKIYIIIIINNNISIIIIDKYINKAIINIED